MEYKTFLLGRTAVESPDRISITSRLRIPKHLKQLGIVRHWKNLHAKWKPLRKSGYIWLITMTLLVAAQSTLIWAPKVGIYVNAIALAGLVTMALVREEARKVAISMAIIPVANMVTSSILPRTIMGSTVILYVTILLLALIYRFIFTLEYPTLKTKLFVKGYGYGLPLMLLIGQIVGVIGYAFLRNHYPYKDYSLPLVAVMAIVFAFTEETLLRGLIQQQGQLLFNPIVAALSTTILYVFLVIDHGTMLTLPVAMLMGGVLSFVYYKKQNLLLTFALNAAAKLVYTGLVAGFILR
jgi:membrane protease YdiL (CAAX protease family)